jgi:hypothetical protein
MQQSESTGNLFMRTPFGRAGRGLLSAPLSSQGIALPNCRVVGRACLDISSEQGVLLYGGAFFLPRLLPLLGVARFDGEFHGRLWIVPQAIRKQGALVQEAFADLLLVSPRTFQAFLLDGLERRVPWHMHPSSNSCSAHAYRKKPGSPSGVPNSFPGTGNVGGAPVTSQGEAACWQYFDPAFLAGWCKASAWPGL